MIDGKCACGAVTWRFDGVPEWATACNCTVCRRYGTLWAYDYEGRKITVAGKTSVYTRGDKEIGFHFCPTCGCVACWRGARPGKDRRRRIAVNVRLAEPDSVAHLPIRHFEGLESWKDLPDDGRCVSDMWF
jgi:hypothetical protein